MVGAPRGFESKTKTFLAGFDVIGVSPAVAEQAVSLRRDYRIKLPDAVVWATAMVQEAILVSRDIKDFPPGQPGIRVPYQL